jgi:hypothetical protein
MKKFYSLLVFTALFCALPNVQCGDTVKWVLGAGSHTTTSTTIPAGATPWDQPINSVNSTYSYIVPAFSGVYNYKCTPHGFTGSFTVTCAIGIDEYTSLQGIDIYPNPSRAIVKIMYSDADEIRILDMTGIVVSSISLSKYETEKEVDLSNLSSGVYFCLLQKDGSTNAVKRIIHLK